MAGFQSHGACFGTSTPWSGGSANVPYRSHENWRHPAGTSPSPRVSSGVHAKKIKQGDLPRVVGYMLKSPCWAYRLSRLEEKGPDGEVQTDINGQALTSYMQGKSELRPGERITLFHTMKGHYLDKLAVAGGTVLACLLVPSDVHWPSSIEQIAGWISVVLSGATSCFDRRQNPSCKMFGPLKRRHQHAQKISR